MIIIKQKGSTLLITLVVLSSLSAILYSVITHITIERQAFQSYSNQLEVVDDGRAQLQLALISIANHDFAIIDQLNLHDSQIIPTALPHYQTVATKLSTTELQLTTSYNNTPNTISSVQSLYIELIYQEDETQWQLLNSQWFIDNP